MDGIFKKIEFVGISTLESGRRGGGDITDTILADFFVRFSPTPFFKNLRWTLMQ